MDFSRKRPKPSQYVGLPKLSVKRNWKLALIFDLHHWFLGNPGSDYDLFFSVRQFCHKIREKRYEIEIRTKKNLLFRSIMIMCGEVQIADILNTPTIRR